MSLHGFILITVGFLSFIFWVFFFCFLPKQISVRHIKRLFYSCGSCTLHSQILGRCWHITKGCAVIQQLNTVIVLWYQPGGAPPFCLQVRTWVPTSLGPEGDTQFRTLSFLPETTWSSYVYFSVWSWAKLLRLWSRVSGYTLRFHYDSFQCQLNRFLPGFSLRVCVLNESQLCISLKWDNYTENNVGKKTILED